MSRIDQPTSENPGGLSSVRRFLDEAPEFSVVLGGPLFQLLRRAHISGGALELARRRIVVISLFAWLPLLVLSAIEGQAIGTTDVVSFLRDIEVHARLLVALPLLIVAELVVHSRLRHITKQFMVRALIPPASEERFMAAIASVFRLRNSVTAEVILIAVVYGIGVMLVWRNYFALDAATWFALPGTGGPQLSLAGTWYGYVSLPLFQFLLLRWYFRLFIWWRFIWSIARIDMSLIPTHPDRVGGLGFISHTVYAFVPLLLAHGVLLAGMIAGRIFYTDAGLLDFKVEIAIMFSFLMFLVVGPLLLFSPKLAALKRTAELEYGVLAQRYVREFDVKWLRGGATPNDTLLGSADVQSLADLDEAFQIVHSVRVVPIMRDAVMGLAVALALPLLPLALTLMSTEELMQRLLRVLF